MSQALREEEEDADEEEKYIEGDVQIARQVFERGYKDLKSKDLKEEVCMSFWSSSFISDTFYSASYSLRAGKNLSANTVVLLILKKCRL